MGHVWRLLDQRPDLQQHQPHPHPGAVSTRQQDAAGADVNALWPAVASGQRPAVVKTDRSLHLILRPSTPCAHPPVGQAASVSSLPSLIPLPLQHITNISLSRCSVHFTLRCSVADAFYAKLKQRAQSINIGDPLQPGCRMGPIVSAAQYERVRSYVQVRAAPGSLLLQPLTLAASTGRCIGICCLGPGCVAVQSAASSYTRHYWVADGGTSPFAIPVPVPTADVLLMTWLV